MTGLTMLWLWSLDFLAVVESITVLRNANIYTVNPNQPHAQALAVGDDGIILNIGSYDEIMDATRGMEIDTIDMGGRLVLPGFHDVHLHVVEAGLFSVACVFDPFSPVLDLPLYFDECDEFGDQGWLLGSGVDISYLLEAVANGTQFPIDVLDNAFPNTPVLILDNLGHGAVANSVAMTAVGYDVLTGDPPGGMISRVQGALTGIVLENAQQKLRDAVFPPTEANLQTAYEALLGSLKTLAANGITSVSDAGGFWRQAQTESWARAEAEGVLTVRASNALYVYPDQSLEEQLPELLQRYSNDSSTLVRFNQAKIYVDGILDLGTGALFEPYQLDFDSTPEDGLGFEYFGDNVTLNAFSKALAENGFKLHFHVTGDRGASLALDAIDALPIGVGHRLTHCFLLNEEDIDRLVRLNVFADFQVAPSSVSQENLDFMAEVLGNSRMSDFIPILSVFNAGGKLTLSSDWDADNLSPLLKIKTVLSRLEMQSLPDVESVIPLMTRNAADLLQTNAGSLEVGKVADLVALDMNIFNVSISSIDDANVVFTMFNGKAIFDPADIASIPQNSSSPAPTPGSTPPSGSSLHMLSFLALASMIGARLLAQVL